MRPRLIAPLVLLLAILATQACAYTYGDTLTTIWRPLPNLPALARPGDPITVWANAPSTASNWAASLKFGALEVGLAPTGGGWQANKGRWELSFSVPAATPEEIYALILTSDSTAPDTATHAVKVLPAYLTDYYFAQISDTHLPEHTFSTAAGIDTADTTGMRDFDAVIEDLNVIHPQFIIHTGDLVNEGELEEYLGMYEMGRAMGMLNRLRDPVWVSTGNHDVGGWDPTPPPPGTSRKNWWRYFGWPFLGSPPAGDPYHSQDFTFDYGPLHVIGLEAYNNSGSYDDYLPAIYGPDSFTAEQLAWLQSDIAAQPPGTHKLAFYHYDFGGAGPDFSQINPAALGLDGAIWGHNHGVAEGAVTAVPFNLGLKSVIDNRRFRIFRVHNGVITPAFMHASGTATDSLSLTWVGANNGTRSIVSAAVFNRFQESFEHARLVFNMVDHDSSFVATGGTIAQVLRQGGIASVYVDFVLPVNINTVVTVRTDQPVLGTPVGGSPQFALHGVSPNPFTAGASRGVAIRFSLPSSQHTSVEVFDAEGRRVAWLANDTFGPGDHVVHWDGRAASGELAPAAVYLVRLTGASGSRATRFALTR